MIPSSPQKCYILFLYRQFLDNWANTNLIIIIFHSIDLVTQFIILVTKIVLYTLYVLLFVEIMFIL